MVSNHFRLSFYTLPCVWLCMKNRIFQKNISFDRKIKALTRKLFYVSIFTSNHFQTQTRKERERERERVESLWLRATKHSLEIAPRSSRRDCATWSLPPLDRSRPPLGQITSPLLGRSHRPPLADLSPPLGRSHHWFAFSLWSLIFFVFCFCFCFLLLWWCGWWRFGGFCVVWWWIFCGWWWIFCGCWCVGGGGFCDIKFVWKLRKCEKL